MKYEAFHHSVDFHVALCPFHRNPPERVSPEAEKVYRKMCRGKSHFFAVEHTWVDQFFGPVEKFVNSFGLCENLFLHKYMLDWLKVCIPYVTDFDAQKFYDELKTATDIIEKFIRELSDPSDISRYMYDHASKSLIKWARKKTS